MKAARENWLDDQDDLDPEQLIFIDESGLSTKMARLRGWAPKGERSAQAFEALISTILTASRRGLGGSSPSRRTAMALECAYISLRKKSLENRDCTAKSESNRLSLAFVEDGRSIVQREGDMFELFVTLVEMHAERDLPLRT